MCYFIAPNVYSYQIVIQTKKSITPNVCFYQNITLTIQVYQTNKSVTPSMSYSIAPNVCYFQILCIQSVLIPIGQNKSQTDIYQSSRLII